MDETVKLQALLDWMKRNAVKRARTGDLELELEPQYDMLTAEDLEGQGRERYGSPYEDPDLYPDGIVPRLRKPEPEAP